MEIQRKPMGYWTKEKCHEEALKYEERTKFKKKSGGAYFAAFKKEWLDEVCSHMNRWPKEKCQAEALKHNTRSAFFKKSNGAYNAARINGWLDEVCSHMTSTRKSKGYWTKERCHEEALKFKTKTEFKIESRSAYESALKKGWLDNICSHMESLKKIKGYWGKDRCREEALKYKTRSEFRIKSRSAYSSSLRKGWLEDVCSHMQSNVWTKEKCYQEALKCKTRTEFSKNSFGAYNAARRKGWLDEACSHMTPLSKPKGYWTKEKCHAEALKCKTRNEFKIKLGSAYQAAARKGWLNEICSHITPLRKPKGYWTKEKCHAEALKCKTRNEFKIKLGSAYNAARRNGWLDEICSHMTP